MIVFVATLFSSLIIFAVGLMISHKIAGPLYRLRFDLDNMAEQGTLSKVNFRDKDYFIELEKSFNNLAEKLNKG
jgi:signal transduction histidine kinase